MRAASSPREGLLARARAAATPILMAVAVVAVLPGRSGGGFHAPFGAGAVSPAPATPALQPNQADGRQSSSGRYFAQASGNLLHLDAVKITGGSSLVDVEVGVSSASVDSRGLDGQALDEFERVVRQAPPTGTRAHGRGSGLSVEAAGLSLFPNLLLSDPAETTAPPSSPMVSNEVASARVDNVVLASVLRGEATAAWSEETCALGQPLGYGAGSVADVRLLDLTPSGDSGSFDRALLALDAGNPTDRRISQSKSLTYLVPTDDGSFTLVSEARAILAPVTVFPGTPGEVTVELLGEVVLRAEAGGDDGEASVSFAPAGDPSPTTPILRLVQGGAATQLTVEQVFGEEGLTLDAGPLVTLSVAGHPRRIAPPGAAVQTAEEPELATDGTSAAGAADLLRLTIVEPAPADTPRVLDVRIGHLEARAAVPIGGVHCPIPVRKTGVPALLGPGEGFTWTISIPSAPDALGGVSCDLAEVRALDTASSSEGVAFRLLGASDGGVIDGRTVRWDNLGTYRRGAPPIVTTIQGRLEPNSQPGTLTDVVEVQARLVDCSGGSSGAPLSAADFESRVMTGRFRLLGPRVPG
ncbi:MAG: hypothetical protein ACRDV9_15580 [Acidimicrobiia bacterium]